MHKKNVSINDVAAHAKVSITTVSRVINNQPSVSDKSRKKVEEAIRVLNFKPNVSAQRLATGVTNAIGLVMPSYPGIFYSFYAVELIRGVGHACEELGLDMVFHITNGQRPINTKNVGGIIFADIIENRKQIETAISMNTPTMVINNNVVDLETPYIAIDNRLGGKIVAEYFHGLGHKNMAIITGNLATQPGLLRYEGFKSYLEKQGCPLKDELVFKGDYSRRSAREGIETFLNLPEDLRPTAVFVCSDDMALEVVGAVLEKGMKVPEDISVVGFDDNPACLYGPVALTTVRQPLFEMAQQAVHRLYAEIKSDSEEMNSKDQTSSLTLSPELVLRESAQRYSG